MRTRVKMQVVASDRARDMMCKTHNSLVMVYNKKY